MDNTSLNILDPASRKRYQDRLDILSELPLISKILTRLKNELPDKLTYHNHTHTEEVLRDTLLLAIHDGLDDREIELLAIAAAWHDAGFLYQYEDNEGIAARLVADEMSEDPSYTQADVHTVSQMILDTKVIAENGSIKRNVSSHLSKYLLDADLGNFGKDNFPEMNERIFNEKSSDWESFRKDSLDFLKNHSWHTEGASKLWEAQRKRNMEIYSLKK